MYKQELTTPEQAIVALEDIETRLDRYIADSEYQRAELVMCLRKVQSGPFYQLRQIEIRIASFCRDICRGLMRKRS
jgi:hypothetical protein